MSLHQKAGQVFIFTLQNLRQARNDLRLYPGGFVRIYCDAVSVAKQNALLQAEAHLPLILSADFERGIGSTVAGAIDMAGNMCIGAAGDDDLAFETGKAIAEEALALGVNMNYVPVLDVNTNEENPIINIRAFGGDPELVARMGSALIRGFHAGGVLTCGKHFPGHGDTHIDSHTNLGTIDGARDRLDRIELLPFRRAIEAGVDSIMSAHLVVPALQSEPLPATMSREIMHNLLRNEMGFKGVAVSDALEMGAISRNFTTEDAIVRAFNAGCDQLIMPRDNARAVGTLIDAVRSGAISEARLDEAVCRILAMKESAGLFDAADPGLASLPNRINTDAHYDIARNVALAGITLVKNENNALPLGEASRTAVVTFSNDQDLRQYFTDPKTFGDHCKALLSSVNTVHCGTLEERNVHEHGAIRAALEAAATADAVVVAAYVKVVINSGSVALDDRYVRFVAQLCATGKPVIMVSFGSPYLARQFPRLSSYVCAYGASEATQEAAALLLCGKKPFRGKLPVAIPLPE